MGPGASLAPLGRRAFHAESFAPWCERARWALDHHRVHYAEIEQVPLIAEVKLRLVLRRLRGRVTVPVLVHDGGCIMGSDDIARYAELHGAGAPLFVSGVEQWMGESERLMVAGRALLLPRMAADTAALEEQLPRAIPPPLRTVLRPTARLGVAHLMAKYGVRRADEAAHHQAMRSVLSEVRAALRGRGHLLGGALSYADVTMAAALQFVLPVGDNFIRLGPTTRRVWTHPVLAAEFGDLLAWRDTLYATFRRV